MKKPDEYCVYIIRLKDRKHYYVGSTGNLKNRLQSHARANKGIHRANGAFASRAYGFTNLPNDIRVIYKCNTREEAIALELRVAYVYRELFPDIPICGDHYPFGIYRERPEIIPVV